MSDAPSPLLDRPMRIRRSRAKGARLPKNTVCVDRTTGFGSPFPIASVASTISGLEKKMWFVGTWTRPSMCFADTKEEAATISVKAYRWWMGLPAQATLRDKAKVALRGKNLACWCKLDAPCHADVLLEIVNAD